MTAQAQKSVGTAIYLELQKERAGTFAFCQVIVTPQGTNSDGTVTPVTLIHRQLNASRKRTTWRFHSGDRTTTTTAVGVDIANALEVASAIIAPAGAGSIGHTLNRLAAFGYILEKTPIYVEVSEADLSQIYFGKTPYKLIGRIDRTRKVLGWPDDVTQAVIRTAVAK